MDANLSPEHHTQGIEIGFSDTLAPSDPRWILATRSQMVFQLGRRVQSMGAIHDLVEIGTRLGFSEFASRSIIDIADSAQLRGGLDHAAKDALLGVPLPTNQQHTELSPRARWMVFGVLFGWALLIAGAMQMV